MSPALTETTITAKTSTFYMDTPSRRGRINGQATAFEENGQRAANIEEIRRILQSFQQPTTTQTELSNRLSTTRHIISWINNSNILDGPDHYEDQVWMINQIQCVAYHDSDRGAVEDIAQWSIRAYLQVLVHAGQDAPEVLMGMFFALRFHRPCHVLHFATAETKTTGDLIRKYNTYTAPQV
jgi:hypothetical protein